MASIFVWPMKGYVSRYGAGWCAVAHPGTRAVFPEPRTEPFKTAWGAASALLKALGER